MTREELPLVTAVIPVYNHEKYVVESIRSILGQSYPNIELIVINDGSQDRSHEMILTLLEECKQRFSRFEYINRTNMGLSATLNQALSMAKGKYFSALASDDIALSTKFTLLVDALESADSSCAAAFGNALFINENGQRVELGVNGTIHESKSTKTSGTFLEFYTQYRDFDYRSEDFGTYRTLLRDNYLPAMSNIVRTDLLREVDGWSVGNLVEDWEMWLKLSKRHTFLLIDRPMALYRLHGLNSLSVSTNKLILSSLVLVTGEREYCVQHSLSPVWRDSLNSQLYQLLRHRQIKLSEKLNQLMRADKSSFLRFILRKGENKLAMKLFQRK
jgi:alpha-1,3-rhamnosyltransferase